MPIYEYACRSCGHTLEKFQSMKEAPLIVCEHCQKPDLIKLVSAAGFRLKGSGWYETDFKSDTDKKKNLFNTEDNSPKGEAQSTSAHSTETASAPSSTLSSGSEKSEKKEAASKDTKDVSNKDSSGSE